MKIAQIVCVFPPYQSGIGNVAYHFAEELSRLNNEVTVFAPAQKLANEKKYGFDLQELNPYLRYGNAAFLPQLVWRLKNFDIVHLHYPFFGATEPIWLAKILGLVGKKLVIHYHMDIESLPITAKILSWPNNIIRASLFGRADAITCASLDYLQNSQIKDSYKTEPAKFFTIPFGVDLEKFKPADDWHKKKNNILFVAALDRAHYFKGLDILLKAMTHINKEIKLTIVGSGELLADYQTQAKELEIAERVVFAGAVADKELPKYYQQADLLVLPSINKHEAFGLVLLEALASGVPVVASDLPGVRSVFVDSQQGYLSLPGDINSLTEKIKQVLDNDANWQKMCQQAHAWAEEKYSWKKVGKSLNSLYLELLK
jgi:glycosyltransferase involved in cell wall biosynthesis